MANRTWTSTTLGALIDSGAALVQTGPFGSQLHSYDYQPVGIPVIPTEAIGHRRLRSESVPKISVEKAAELERHRLLPGDILFARRGVQATGYSAIVEKQHDGWLCGTGAILLRLKSKEIDPGFLSFYLAHAPTIEWLKAHAVGAVMPNLNESVLRMLPITLPPVGMQFRIADILGTFDHKIDLNRQMNETLEATARALFKSWFVDFDPVRDKASGRPPTGLDAATAALFPDVFEESELGPVPKGWKVRPVGETVKAVGGATPSTDVAEYWNGHHAWATPKDLAGLTAPVLLTTERKITDSGISRISSGLLPKGTLLLSSRAPIGYLAIAEIPVAINQGFIAMVCDSEVSNYFMLNWCRTNMDTIESRASGTTFQEISKANFRPIPILVPEAAVLAAFDRIVQPLYQQISRNVSEGRTMANTRDTLLPQLLSGEIRVKQAEELVA